MSPPKNPRRPPAPEGPDSRRPGLFAGVLLALIVLTFTVFAPVRTHGFLQFDDAAYVTENAHVKAGLTLDGLRWALTTPYAGNWHPLTWASHMADVELFGLDAGWHHLTNLWLHLLTTALLFRLFTRMTGSIGASAFVAAMFAVHPLHVESVAWVAERKDVLSGLFWVLTLGAYVAFTRRPHRLRYLWLVVCFGLALLSKPMAVTLPFVLLLLDVWPLARWRGLRASMIEKAPLFLMAAAAALVTFIVQREAGAVQSLEAFPLSLRLANVPMAYVWYAFATIYPVNLAPLYPYPASIPLWQSAGAAAILLAITVWVSLRVRTHPFLFVGYAWFMGTLVPVIGLVQIGSPPHSDRYMYLPAIGLFVMAAWAVERWARRRPAWTRAIVALAIIDVVIAAGLTSRQVAHWKNDVTLWEHAVAVTRDNYRAQTNFGFALASAGMQPRALDAYQEAIRLNPRYPNAHNYLGLLLADLGDHDRAASEYQAALALAPGFVEAHNNLGLTRAAQNRIPAAIAAFEQARRLNPSFAEARSNLGIAYAQQGEIDRAIVEFEEAVRLKPASPESRMNLATALAEAGRTSDAIAALRATLRLAPAHAEASKLLRQLEQK